MARHPDISEEAIIQAGKEIESTGKRPNPGAIRAHLGYRGGLLRIKAVWETFVTNRQQELLPSSLQEFTFDALPEDYADNANTLMSRVNNAIEQLAIEAYQHSQALFEKRVTSIETEHKAQLSHYSEAERAADNSVSRLESELSELQDELSSIAEQNAKLLLENSELRGRLAVFDEKFGQEKVPRN